MPRAPREGGRRRATAYAVLASALGIGTFGGCAAITGLDSLSEQACAPDCQGAGDGSASGDSAEPLLDAAVGDGQQADTGDAHGGDATLADGGIDAKAPFDASLDAGESGLAYDAAEEDAASPDAADANGGADSGMKADTGCGPLDSIDNCSACGDECHPTNASLPTCNGATCSYSCATDYLDCNDSVAPDLDGCECHAPGAMLHQCCGNGCPETHSYDEDITTSTFYDCVAPGAYNITLAMDACAAYTGNGALCDDGFTFSCNSGGDASTVIADMVCSNGYTGACACWSYDGTLVGRMHIGTESGTASLSNCLCPSALDPNWD